MVQDLTHDDPKIAQNAHRLLGQLAQNPAVCQEIRDIMKKGEIRREHESELHQVVHYLGPVRKDVLKKILKRVKTKPKAGPAH